MLGKERPEGRDDWVKVINFIAWNVEYSTCLPVCQSIASSHNAPLTTAEIEEIVDYQTYNRAARELAAQEKTAGLLSEQAIRDVNEFFGDGFTGWGG